MPNISVEQLHKVGTAIRNNQVKIYQFAWDAAKELFEILDAAPGVEPVQQLSANARLLVREVSLFLDEPTHIGAEKFALRAELADGQCELFQHYANVFGALTGHEFTSSTQSPQALEFSVKERLQKRSVLAATGFALDELANFYYDKGAALRSHCSQLGGVKVLVNKGDGFERHVIRSIRKMGLYVDTQMLPDPFSPIAMESRERGLENVPGGGAQLATALRRMLQLKPLVDARLPVPPLMVFPCQLNHWRTFPPDTEFEVERITTEGLARAYGLKDASSDAVKREMSLNLPLCELRLFQTGLLPTRGFDPYLRPDLCQTNLRMMWRLNAQFRDRPLEDYLWTTVRTSFHEQFLFYNNLKQFEAHPAASDERAQRLQTLCNGFVADQVSLPPESKLVTPIIRAMQENSLVALTNATIPQLVVLLQQQENLQFRERLSELAESLGGNAPDGHSQTVKEVHTAISRLIAEHEKKARNIADKYNRVFSVAGLTVGVGLLGTLPKIGPFLSPLYSDTPLAMMAGGVAMLALQGVSQHVSVSNANKTLVGILAAEKPEYFDV